MNHVFYLSHPKSMAGTKALTEIGQFIEKAFEGILRIENPRIEKYQAGIFFRRLEDSTAAVIVPMPDFSVASGQADDARYMLVQGKPVSLFDPGEGGRLLAVKSASRNKIELEDGRIIVVRNLYASQKFHRAAQWRMPESMRAMKPYSSMKAYTEAIDAGCVPMVTEEKGRKRSGTGIRPASGPDPV